MREKGRKKNRLVWVSEKEDLIKIQREMDRNWERGEERDRAQVKGRVVESE